MITKEEIIRLANEDEDIKSAKARYSVAKLKTSLYFVDGIREFIGKLAFDNDFSGTDEELTIAELEEMVNAVLS